MDYAFRHLPRIDPPDPEPGELHLRPRSSVPRDARRLACLAVETGPDAFVRGDGPVRCIVVQGDPTLDDMLAALFVERRLAGESLPAGAAAFAEYAAVAREGLKPGDVPLVESLAGVYLAVRHEAGEDLGRDEARRAFLDGWRKLGRVVLEAAAAGKNPFTQPLFAGDPAFAGAVTFLTHDREVYADQDAPAGERWRMLLPGGPKRPVAGFRFGGPPRSVLWKYWAREDPEAPGGRGYPFLAVFEEPRHWRFSTDPVQRLPIRSLADKLQTAEAAEDPIGAAADPWYDGAHFGHTIIGAPRRGTRLSDAAVLALVKQWASVRPADAPPRGRRLAFAAASLLLGCVALVAVTWVAVRHLPARTPAPAEAASLMTATVNGRGQQRVEVSEGLTGATATTREDLNFQPNHPNTVVFRAARRVSEPVKLRVTFSFPDREVPLGDVTVKVNGEKESDPLPLEPAGDRELVTPEVDAFFEAGPTNVITVTADNPGELTRVIVRLDWHADLAAKRDLYLFAVGVSDYQSPQLRLCCAAKDAEDLAHSFKGQEGRLFRKVHVQTMVDGQVVKATLLGQLEALKEKVPPDSLVLVTISGHGKRVRSTGRYLFLPYDFDPATPVPQDRGVSWEDLQDCLTGFKCPVILVLDTCHSGAAGTGLRGSDVTSPEALQAAVGRAADLFKGARSGVVVLAGCMGDELGQESDKWGHGALTLALLEGLEGHYLYPEKTDAPLPKGTPDGIITLEDLYDYAVHRVQALTRTEQTVQLRATDGLHPARIPITLKTATASR